MTEQRFVKSADTKTPAGNSKAELERILRRYGASGFSVAENYTNGEIVVSFIVPDAPGGHSVPVKLPVSVRAVEAALFGPQAKRKGKNKLWESQQAERVAWRHLVLWVDAALSASAAGLQTVTEAFFAHTIAGDAGERMIDVVRSEMGAFSNVRALLGAGDATE